MFGFNSFSSASFSSQVDLRVESAYGTYTTVGQTANIYRNKAVILDYGLYNVIGQNALIYKNKVVTADQGTYFITGQSAEILKSKFITGSYGTYLLTGQDASLARNKVLAGDYGTYSLTGYTAAIIKGRALLAEQGSYTITGKEAQFFIATPYPNPQYVLKGIVYGPGGIYIGTFDGVDKSLKIDLTTGAIVKPISNKVVISL